MVNSMSIRRKYTHINVLQNDRFHMQVKPDRVKNLNHVVKSMHDSFPT